MWKVEGSRRRTLTCAIFGAAVAVCGVGAISGQEAPVVQSQQMSISTPDDVPAVADPGMVPSSAAPSPVRSQLEADGKGSNEPVTLPHDLTPMGMFFAADIVVKSVMVGLALASLVTWTIWLAKNLELSFARVRLNNGLRIILNAPDLDSAVRALAAEKGPAASMVRSAYQETQVSVAALSGAGNLGLLQRITSHLSGIEAQAGRRLATGTGVLATIGSTAPFVGLFGTVWGIMNAFIGISESQTTNLAVVAPGIAEALLATALGLVAAIPAVVIYNAFARSISGYRARLADAAAGVERLVSRDLDHRRIAPIPFGRAAE